MFIKIYHTLPASLIIKKANFQLILSDITY